ncbi:MAG: hypothetical protein K0S79_2712 [Nitrospira sp.]|nr:hypothetical protein [Nitrospira sp.]
MVHEGQIPHVEIRCDGCRTDQGPFMKLSMGKDFFGRSYDRLSPSRDQSPKWYCDLCSMYKNLQRDCRDIRGEWDKVVDGLPSELTHSDGMHRARLRLQEVAAILSTQRVASSMIDPHEVNALIRMIQGQLLLSSADV